MNVCWNGRKFVGEGRCAKARMEFARRRAPAGAFAPLDHNGLDAGPGEQRRSCQALCARADNGSVVAHRSSPLSPPIVAEPRSAGG